MAHTDHMPAAAVVRLVSAPFDQLLPWEQSIALGLVSKMADEIVDADLVAVIRSRHTVPDWGPIRYSDVVLAPALEDGLLPQEAYDAWQERLQSRWAIDDPRVRLFCKRRQNVALQWQLELDQKARTLARLLSADPEEVKISAFDQTNGRALWDVEGTLYLLHDAEERLVMAMDFLATQPLASLDYLDAVHQVSGIPMEQLRRFREMRDAGGESAGAADSALIGQLEERGVPAHIFAAAILDSTDDWVPFLTARLADDGVEYQHGSYSLIKFLALNPALVDFDEEEDEGPDFSSGGSSLF